MAQIIILTNAAKTILQPMVFNRINELEGFMTPGSVGEEELDTLHKIYADIVNTKR